MSIPSIHAAGHLLARAWANLISALSTSTLSILVFTVAVPAITSITVFSIDFRRERKAGTPIKDIVTRSLFDQRTAVALKVLPLTWVVLFGGSVIWTIYNDHIALVKRAVTAEHQSWNANTERERLQQQLLSRDITIEAQSRRIAALQEHREAEESGTHLQMLGGTYEWQWAGDGWIGRIEMSKGPNGRLDGTMHMMKYCGGQLVPLMDAKGPIYSDKTGLRLELAAKVSNYDAQCKFDHASTPLLKAILQPVAAYAGTVRYLEGKPESPPGDMILIRYESKRHIY